MLMVCHHVSPAIPEDVAFANRAFRAEDDCRRGRPHDLGAISMMSSDSQAMAGRRSHYTHLADADKMKTPQRGRCPVKKSGSDNVPRAALRGEVHDNPRSPTESPKTSARWRPEKLADLVLWKPAFFASSPRWWLKGGMIAWS